MTHYEFLRQEQERGTLRQWYQYGLAVQTENWMKYYEYRVLHPEKSYLEIASHFSVTHSTIGRAVTFMNQEHRCATRTNGLQVSENCCTFVQESGNDDSFRSTI